MPNRKLKKISIIRSGCDIDFYPDLFLPEKATEIFEFLDRKVHWKKNAFSKKTGTFHKGLGANQNYGDAGISYDLHFGGYDGSKERVTHREVLAWDKLPFLARLRDGITKITGQEYNYCCIQRYPSGMVGIHPHRDRETKSSIAGISFGETRVLRMVPPHYIRTAKPIDFKLRNGSMYILNKPTNDHWKHSILPDPEAKGARISITFRYQSI